MTRTETTKFLGKLLTDTRLGGAGSHWASEVSIDPWTPKARRVDYMEFSPANQCSVSGIEKGIFTCYEIKSCKEDVYSGTHLLEPMKKIVKELMDEGKTVEEIGKQLGMRPEEIFRLSDFSKEDFLKMMTKGVTGYSKAEFITKI